MPSKKHVDSDLEFPWATPAEAEALWRVRELDRMTPEEYLAWCTELTRDLPSSREDLNSPDDKPFTLP
jgi:hypothetical protein